MSVSRLACGLTLAVIMSVISENAAVAQNDGVSRRHLRYGTAAATTRTFPRQRKWHHQQSYYGRGYVYASQSAAGIPFLVDTNGRKCMGFGRLFPIVGRYAGNRSALREQQVTNDELRRLGEAMVERKTEDVASDSEMPAGYTFLAQFIDHDITFDTTSMLNRPIRDDEFENARTVDLDLDSLYGRGPEQDPHLYNLPYLRVGRWIGGCGSNARFDLLRVHRSNATGPRGGAARALIGDPRNDENFIIAQLHATFIAYHNRMVDLLIERRLGRRSRPTCGNGRLGCDTRRLALSLPRGEKLEIFEAARNHVIHYYHRVIMEDFLPRLIGEARMRDILRNGRSLFFPNGFSRNGKTLEHPFIPIEFAVGAFRYGHSQVREGYQLRRGVRTTLLDAVSRSGGGSPAFRPVRRRHLVDWRYFFPITRGRLRGFNLARRIDTDIAPFLHELGRSRVVGRNDVVSLPARNLIRGNTFRLPSGQAVAAHILPMLYNRGLLAHDSRRASRRNRHRTADWSTYLVRPDKRTRHFIRHGETPLWYYIIQEAAAFGGPSEFGANGRAIAKTRRRRSIQYASLSRRLEPSQPSSQQYFEGYNSHNIGGHTLGPVGATLVGEVLTGLIEHYRTKLGKGLSFRPLVRAAIGNKGNSPLTLTPLPHIYPKFYGRYLMRNLLIDVGQASRISSHGAAAHECRYRHENSFHPGGTSLENARRRYKAVILHNDRRLKYETSRHRRKRRKDLHWAHKAFQND